MVDASAVASVLGISTQFEDMRGGAVLNLPQRVAVFAQGQTGVSYSTDKWQATGAGAAGAKYGWKSAIYFALRELLPANGDGVGTIPVDVYPLQDAGGSVVAAGSITPSGTPTKATSYRARVNGYLGDQFVIPAGALATAANLHTAVRRIGESIASPLAMPVNVAYTYSAVTTSALVGTGNGTLTALAVHAGSRPMPGVWKLTCVTATANGGTWKLVDPEGNIVSSTLAMTAGAGLATVFSDVGGLDFTLTDGSTDFGAGAEFTITVPATAVNLTCGWKGASGNDLVIEIIATESVGVVFTLVQPAGGLVNPSVAAALNSVGTVWETMALNALNIEDTTTLDLFKTWGEGRWGELMHKPCVVFTGNTYANIDEATAVCTSRKDDRVNAQLVAPGSPNLPFVVAARQLARIVKVANDNPPTGYNAEKATGLLSGLSGEQWDYAVRDIAVKRGSSTIEVVDDVINIGDVVTFWRPTGEEPPAYRYVCDIVKLQNILFNLQLIFAAKEWAAAPLIPDSQVTKNPKARKPKSAVAAVNALLGNLGDAAIISDPKTSKKLTTAVIDSQNPKRLNVTVKVQLSGNTYIKDVGLKFGFYFGQALAA